MRLTKHGRDGFVVEVDRFASAEALAQSIPIGEAVRVEETDTQWLWWEPSSKRLQTVSGIALLPMGGRIFVANTTKDIILLEKLAQDADLFVRHAAANNPKTPRKVRGILANEGLTGDLHSISKNPKTTPTLLREIVALAMRGDASMEDAFLADIRFFVAGNPSAPPDVLVKLAEDRIFGVRMAVAKNTNAPPDALAIMASDTRSKDSSWQIREAVVSHENTPVYALAALARDSTYPWVANAAKNRILNHPSNILAKKTWRTR